MKLTWLAKLNIAATILVAVIVTILVLNNSTTNHINNFINIMEFYATKPDKNMSIQFRTENTAREGKDDQALLGKWRDQYSSSISNGTNNSDPEERSSTSVPHNAANVSLTTTKLLVMILSGPDEKHEMRRQCVRSSYLSIEQWRENYKHFFLIGHTANETLERNIAQEDETFKDIVRYPGFDTYSTLATKVMWGFYHILRTWDLSFNLILKTDDDSFVNVGNVIRTFQSIELSGNFYGGGRRYPGRKANVKKKKQFKDLYSEDFKARNVYMITEFVDSLEGVD